MKVTFPHMGNIFISVKVLLDILGIDYVIPPNCNKKTFELGIAHSPEFMCLPFKIIMGDFIHGIENGAEVILFCGGDGQCRLGYYSDLYEEILKDLGYKVKIIRLDVAKLSFKEVIHKFKPLTRNISQFDFVKGIIFAAKMILAVDKLHELANHTRCRELTIGETDKIINRFHNKVRTTKDHKAVKELISSSRKELKKIKIDPESKPLKIAIVGEIYVATETYANMDIERVLGKMGVEVHNTLSASHWIKEHFIKRLFPFSSKDTPHEAGKELMKTDDIGGHGLETIGNIILCAKSKYDGVIHLYPFTCMPEIVAQSTFDEIQDRYQIPIMTLILDEMTGEAGHMTRIEAFIDMIRRRREVIESGVQFCK